MYGPIGQICPKSRMYTEKDLGKGKYGHICQKKHLYMKTDLCRLTATYVQVDLHMRKKTYQKDLRPHVSKQAYKFKKTTVKKTCGRIFKNSRTYAENELFNNVFYPICTNRCIYKERDLCNRCIAVYVKRDHHIYTYMKYIYVHMRICIYKYVHICIQKEIYTTDARP